ncbi:MAG TPA: response regulator transcription factor [Burkholderiaceae bacterium]|jgi:DNA-binding NarL/FixJ family response regulator|nr:response regulator transcription factor [Burkholderiaceae bacterium]
MRKVRVLIADDHALVREGLRALLQAQPDIEVIGEAETGREAVQLARTLNPDVVLMDIAMPLLSGLEATRQIAKQVPSTRVLIVSSYSDDEYVHQLAEAGGAGYVLKQTTCADMVRAIHEAKKGNAFFSPAISRRLSDHYRESITRGTPVKERTDLLTSRETEVLQLIAEGDSNKRIASELGIGIKTVERHRQRLMDKLGIHDVAGLTRYAISRGLVETSAAAPRTVLDPP